jgi:hypothetical protein
VAEEGLLRQRARQVGHSLNVIAELPRYVDDQSIPIGLRVAAIDSFYVHVRLIAEFFVNEPDRRRPAIWRKDYAAGFHLDTALRERLVQAFDFASKHVVHYSADRVPDAESSGVGYTRAADLQPYVADAFEAMTLFVRTLRDRASLYADDFAALLAEAESRR